MGNKKQVLIIGTGGSHDEDTLRRFKGYFSFPTKDFDKLLQEEAFRMYADNLEIRIKTIRKMKINLELIKHYESLHDGDLTKVGLQPKIDPVGIWTEGWGHAIRDKKGNFVKGIKNKALAEKFSQVKTIPQADILLEQDLNWVKEIIARKITVPLSDNKATALASFIYNTGGSSTLYNLINLKRPNDVIFEWWTTHYITGDGKPLKGLIYRRRTEATLFTQDKLIFFNA